jgi:deoxycytidylate deaminase
VDHAHFFEEAAKIANMATCNQAHCGSVVVAANGQIIGKGYNAPPQGDESQRMCDIELSPNGKPNSDRTCCVHAEWNAILDALKHHADKIEGSTLYFMRTNKKGEFTGAGVPWCTVCSRLALESGIAQFGLWEEDEGPKLFDTLTYNLESYAFYK